MIKLLLAVVSIALPILLFYLNIAHPEVRGGLIFSLFAILVTIAKVWESFYTSNEKGAREYHGDWTLLVTSLLYFFTGLMIVLEFFTINRGINLYFMTIGLLIFFAAAILRYWSIKTLGNQWAIHATGASRLVNDHVLVVAGPYKYVRHPIYISYVMDLLGLVIALSTFYSLILVVLINLPSYILRARYEEISSVKRFGDNYVRYKEKTSSTFPYIKDIIKK